MCYLKSNMLKKLISERLYLSTERNREVFVEDCQLMSQHQIDCIRFLYKQYVKKKPGVILNVPECEQMQVIALFLKAVFNLLDHSVIIYTKENQVQNWEEQLAWTDNISINNLDAKKKINVVHSLKNTYKIWSMMIVASNLAVPREMQQYRATFKIWITQVNLKHNMEPLSQICKWLYCQNDKLLKCFNEFMEKLEKNNSEVMRAIDLDAFLEDIVFGSYGTSLLSRTDSEEADPLSQSTTIEVKETRRRKNKDATGTKIKRSKPKPQSDETQAMASTSTSYDNLIDKNKEVFQTSNKSIVIDENINITSDKNPLLVEEKVNEFNETNRSRNEDEICKVVNAKDDSFEDDSEPLRLELDDESDNEEVGMEPPNFSKTEDKSKANYTVNTEIETSCQYSKSIVMDGNINITSDKNPPLVEKKVNEFNETNRSRNEDEICEVVNAKDDSFEDYSEPLRLELDDESDNEEVGMEPPNFSKTQDKSKANYTVNTEIETSCQYSKSIVIDENINITSDKNPLLVEEKVNEFNETNRSRNEDEICKVVNAKDDSFEDDSEPLRLELDDESDNEEVGMEPPNFSKTQDKSKANYTVNTEIETSCQYSKAATDEFISTSENNHCFVKASPEMTKMNKCEQEATRKYKGSILDVSFTNVTTETNLEKNHDSGDFKRKNLDGDLNEENLHKKKLKIDDNLENNNVCHETEVKSDNYKDVFTKLSEIEEKAKKKFKGSFLDSIF